MIALVLRRVWLIGALPPGPDGGQWLALGRGLLGEHGRSTPGAYAPLVPLVTAAVAEVVGPVEAVRIVALGSYALVVATIAIVAIQAFGGLTGAAIGAAIGSAGALNEPLAFGGYPQQVALAGLVLAGWATARLGWGTGNGNVGVVALGLAVAALSHHLYFPLAVATIAVVWCVAVATRRNGLGPAALRLGLAIAGSAVLAVPSVAALIRHGYAPPLEAVQLSVGEAWQYGAREAPILWLAIVAAGGGGALVTLVRDRNPASALATALLLVGGASFALSAEPRLLPLSLLGGLLGLAALARFAAHGVWPPLAATIPLAVALILVSPGDRATAGYIGFYRVLDPSLVSVAASADALGLPVAVRADRRGWPVGWWLEGLTRERVAVGSDPRWLAFPEEREIAAEVAALFDGTLSPAELRSRADRLGIDLLLVRKWEWIGWERWLSATDPAVEVVFDDGDTLLLRLLPAPRAPQNARI